MKKISDINMISNRMVLAAVFMSMLLLAGCNRQPIYPSPGIVGNQAVIDISALEPEVPRFFTYHTHGKNVSFFVMKLDERIISFLDACASCYTHKRGYHYTDKAVTCRFCNMQFPIYKLEKGLGGCYPIRVEGEVRSGTYAIPVKTLQDSAGKF